MGDPAQETIDYIAVTRLQAAYADVVNRRSWPELDELFLPDAPVHVDTVTVGPKAVGDFIGVAIERFEFFEFVILNTRVSTDVDDDPDAARARLFMCELRQEAATGHWTNAFGVYHDELRRAGGEWRYARRRYQSIARTGRSEVFEIPRPAGFE